MGQERFRQLEKIYYRDAQGVILGFDMTDSDSFDALPFWINDVRNCAPKDAIIVLVGLKLDLEPNRIVRQN